MRRPRGTINAAEAKALYKTGSTISDLARRYRVGYDRMLATLHAEGVAIRSRGSIYISPAEAAEICDAYRAQDIQTVSARFHHSADTIKTILADNDVQLRERGQHINGRSNGDVTNAWRVAAAQHYHDAGLYAVARLYAPEPTYD